MLAGTRVQGVPPDGPSSLDNTDLLRFACAPSRGKEAPAGPDTVCPKWGTAENCSATRRYIVLGTLLVPTAGCAGVPAGGAQWPAGGLGRLAAVRLASRGANCGPAGRLSLPSLPCFASCQVQVPGCCQRSSGCRFVAHPRTTHTKPEGALTRR